MVIVFSVLALWVARSFNRLDEARTRAESKIQRVNSELEGRVRERTEQLVEANRSLEVQIKERIEAESRLRASEANLANAQRIARIGSWVWDIPSGKLEWSDETYRIFGRRPGESETTYEAFLSSVHPGDREEVRRAVDAALSENRPYKVVHRLVRPDGSERVVQEEGEVTYDEEGKPLRMEGTVQDITERRKAEARIEALNRNLETRVLRRTFELEEANEELRAFAYSVSHDLRAPLRSIDGFSQALLEDYSAKLDEEGREYLELVRDGARQMGDFIEDLLKLSRLSHEPMHWSNVDLTAIASEIAEELQKEAPERAVEFTIATGIRAPGDEPLLKVVMGNLLGNAWKFTGQTERTRIEFGAHPAAGETEYFVRDNGAGFDMAYADQLFGAFQRLHSTAEFDGAGIGLATVKRVIHRHHGRVRAEGAVGKGATLYFTLPAEKEDHETEKDPVD